MEDFRKVLEDRKHKEHEGKVQYSTSQSASRARKRMERRFPTQFFNEYSCDFCGTWHVGHMRYVQEKKKEPKNESNTSSEIIS